jgi:hypothetical protein
VATTSAASLSSRKNVVMALSGGGRGPTHGWDLRWCENPVCDVRQVAATPPRRGRRLGEGRRAPEAGRREAEMVVVALSSTHACCAGARERCGSASTAWGARAANDELRLPRVMHGSSDTQEESGSREAAGGGLAALQQMGGATETMRGDDVFLSGRRSDVNGLDVRE